MTDPREKMDAEKPSVQGHEIRKPDPDAALVPEILKLQEENRKERREADRRVAEVRQQAGYEIQKARSEAEGRVANVQQELRTLLRTLARLQVEKDALEQENMFLKARAQAQEQAHAAPRPAPAPPAAPFPGPPPFSASRIPVVTAQPIQGQEGGFGPVPHPQAPPADGNGPGR